MPSMRKQRRVVITGATGTIGRRLAAALAAEEVTVLSRDPEAARRTVRADRFVLWDGRSAIAPSVFEGVDVVYHLAGEPVAGGPWTDEKKRRIEQSRTLSTRAVVEAIAESGACPRLVCASAVGIYGSRGDEILTERSTPANGFLADVCKRWEHEAFAIQREGGSAAILRIGIVLAPDGGALATMLPLFRAGLGGRLGLGRQWMPWIHIDDVVALFLRAAADPALTGTINAVAPVPATNTCFTRALARALRRPACLSVPAFVLRLVFGELADIMLASQLAIPERAKRAGFTFRHPTLESALADLVGIPATSLASQPREVDA